MDSDQLINQRSKKAFEFLKKNSLWVVLALIVLIIIGVYIRVQPMLDHGGRPGLLDITTNTWTLGPDLDPWLFERYAKTIVDNGSLPLVDSMRYSPIGYETSRELQMVSYMVVLTHKVLNLFMNASVIYSADLMPVIFFVFTIVAFFLFVREIFVKWGKGKANVVAIIATLLMVTIPIFLPRTVAGIPEKESVAFFFMFISFYFFLVAWKSEKLRNNIIFSALAGISTGLMGLTWGGVNYVYVTMAVATFVAFAINKVKRKELIAYLVWIAVSTLILLLFSSRFSILDLIESLDTGLAFLVLFVLMMHILLWETRLGKFFEKVKLSRNMISFIAAVIIGIILTSIFFGPFFIFEKLQALNQILFTPISGRWITTVAENRQPYFTEWASSFGPFVGNIPVLFWMFFLGSIVLFWQMVRHLRKKDAAVLVTTYVLFFIGLVFSRYSSSSILNGENFISKLLYYGFALIFIGTFIYYYRKYSREGGEIFEKISFDFIFLFVLFGLCLFTARSAVRLIMVLGTVAPIFAAYLVVYAGNKFNTSEKTSRTVWAVVAIALVFMTLFVCYNFYSSSKSEAYGYIPSYYNQQWQNAMSWVRESTPSGAVFAHWWDYGYWVQSIGERATVLDGSNSWVYWNYLMGRIVLTGDNQKDSLDFLYSHNATHVLIDSSDMGKYGAFSSIGSNKNYDRFSSGPVTLVNNPKATQEKSDNSTLRAYQISSGGNQIGIASVEEDIQYNLNGSNIYLPSQKTGFIGITIEYKESVVKQPRAIFYSQGQQIDLPLRYLYYRGKMTDYGSGLNATAYIIPQIYQSGEGVKIDNIGAMMYISPRLMRGFLGQVYIMNDPLNNFPNFRLVHSERDLITTSLNRNDAQLDDFAYLNGQILGPIKIWNVTYPAGEKVDQKYLDSDYTKYIDWKL